MDRELFVITGSSSSCSSTLRVVATPFQCWHFVQTTTKKKFRLVSAAASPPPPPPAPSIKSAPPIISQCHDRFLAPSFASFGEGFSYKQEKIYTARDIALGIIDVFGWSVEVEGKGEVGKVAEIVHVGRVDTGSSLHIPYEYILKVLRLSDKESSGQLDVNSLHESSASIRSFRACLDVKILIPIVEEFMHHIDPRRKCLVVKPPTGLLELAARPEAISKLQPEIELVCKRYAKILQGRFFGNKKIQCHGISDTSEFVHSYMPTRNQLFAIGRPDLVSQIKAAGGFLYVANALGLKATRRPNGFWDDLNTLDFEIECFLLESWTKQVHKETGIAYFENLVTEQVAMEKPVHNYSREVFAGKQVGSAKVMPRQKLLWKAGRWDLHHAIVWNGGYKMVARLLGRTPIRTGKKRSQQQAEMLNAIFSDQGSMGEDDKQK